MSDVMRLITETARDNSCIIGVWNINSLKADELAQLRQRHEREFVYAREFDALEAALADRDATIARLTAQWERECADTDRVLIALGFSPETGRTEGGSLHLGRILAKCVTLEHVQQRVIEADATIARLQNDARVTALGVWEKWRASLAADRPFTHSDGVRFIYALNAALTPAKEADRG